MAFRAGVLVCDFITDVLQGAFRTTLDGSSTLLYHTGKVIILAFLFFHVIKFCRMGLVQYLQSMEKRKGRKEGLETSLIALLLVFFPIQDKTKRLSKSPDPSASPAAAPASDKRPPLLRRDSLYTRHLKRQLEMPLTSYSQDQHSSLTVLLCIGYAFKGTTVCSTHFQSLANT